MGSPHSYFPPIPLAFLFILALFPILPVLPILPILALLSILVPLFLLLSSSLRHPHRAMNTSQVEAMGIQMLPGYRDPYHGRPLTKGELGCFLSHYNIWKEVGVWDEGGLTHILGLLTD